MPSTKVKHRTTKYNATFWKSKKKFLRWEMVGMRPYMGMSDLVLQWAGGGRPLKVNAAIQSLTITRTIEGASEITMVISDPHGHMFSEKMGRVVDRPRTKRAKKNDVMLDERGKPVDVPTLSGRAVEIELDDVVFRLSKITGDLEDNYTLVFEDRMVYWLRRKKGAISASRSDVTRAEFILRMVREIKAERVPFLCPQLSRKQPIAQPDYPDTRSISALLQDEVRMPIDHPGQNKRGKPKDTDKDSPNPKTGIKDAQDLTVKGKLATNPQRSCLNDVIDAAVGEEDASQRSIVSAICAVITETAGLNPEKGLGGSKGSFQLIPSTARSFNVDPMDIAACTHLYMTKGFTGEGGAIDLAKAHPDWPIYKICQHVQGSGEGRATEGQKNYGPWVNEAKHWLAVYRGTDTDFTPGKASYYRKQYRYHRDKGENSWDAMHRLADEVQWRVFPIGRAMMYSSDTDLFRRAVAETVNKGDPRLLEFNWDMDWNKNPNECEMTVALHSWSAYPGTCIMVDGFGGPDGRWLVTDMERDWFDSTARLTIKQPERQKKEPAPEIGERTEGVDSQGQGGDIGNLYKICRNISDKTPGYVYGGQHGIPLASMHATQGLDCSSSCSLALWRADLWDKKTKTARVSGPGAGSPNFSSWGVEGKGHLFTVMYNDEHVWIKFEEAAGISYERFDTSAWGDGVAGDGPKVRKTTRPASDEARFNKRHWPGM